jgi:hypothetical protein
MEIIFDLEDTSQKQKIDAFDTIKGLLSRGLINRDFMQAHFRPSLGFMWRNITKWQIAEAERDAEWQHLQNPGASLQDVHNLLAFRMMIREKGKIFPSVEYKPENLELEVERRVGAFADADAQSKAPLTMKLKLQKRIHPDDKEVAAELENKRECGEKADVGVVQIARMIETGLAERNAVVKRQGIRREYAKRIEETVKIRSDFARFQKGGVEAAKLYPEMRASVKGKTVREVLSVDEVKNNNLQMPFPVRMDSGMPEYVAKFAVIVARNCFRQALTADDPRQQMTELKAFIGEREGDGIIVKRDLLMPPCLSEDAIDAKMEEMEGRAVLCEQERKAGREAKRILDAVNLAKKTTAEKAANVINLAREEQRLDLLLDPETVAIMTDPQLESEMDSFEISPVIKQSVNQPSAAARTSGSGVSAVAERIDGKLIIYETTQKGKWGEVQKVYRKLVMQLAQNCAQGIMEGENASAQLMLIQKAVNEFHLFKLEDIGINQAQIDAGLDIERARLEKATKAKYLATYEPLKKSALTSKLNDFKSLDQYGTLAGISDPVEAEVLRGILDEICVSKLTGILENLRKGFDTGYMKILAAKMKAKGFEIERHFSDPADLALLQ